MKIRLLRPPGFPVDFEGERYVIEIVSSGKRQWFWGAGAKKPRAYHLVARRDGPAARPGEPVRLSGGFASKDALDAALRDGWELPADPSSLDQTANGIIDVMLRIRTAHLVWEADESFAVCRLEDADEIIPNGFKGFLVLLRRDDSAPLAPEVVVYVDQCLDVGMAAFSIGKMSPAARPVIANERPTHIAYRFYQSGPQESPAVTTGNLFRMAEEFKKRFKPLAS
jgi:hypothetical protein